MTPLSKSSNKFNTSNDLGALFDASLFATEKATASWVTQRRERCWHSPAALSLCSQCGTADPVAAIQRLAAELVEASELQKPAENLLLLASLQDIVAIKKCEMSDAGRLVPTANGLIIQVNQSHPITRQNFSIGHEISHTLMPNYLADMGKTDASVGFYQKDMEEEYLCDIGASEILLPSGDFLNAIGRERPSITTLRSIASSFGVSLEATAIKLIRAEVADLAVAVWEPGWKPMQERNMKQPSLFDAEDVPPPLQKLRLRYAYCSGSMAECFFPKSKSVEEASLIGRAYTEGGIHVGLQKLTMSKASVVFSIEAQAFDYWEEGVLCRKVLSLIFPST